MVVLLHKCIVELRQFLFRVRISVVFLFREHAKMFANKLKGFDFVVRRYFCSELALFNARNSFFDIIREFVGRSKPNGTIAVYFCQFGAVGKSNSRKFRKDPVGCNCSTLRLFFTKRIQIFGN